MKLMSSPLVWHKTTKCIIFLWLSRTSPKWRLSRKVSKPLVRDRLALSPKVIQVYKSLISTTSSSLCSIITSPLRTTTIEASKTIIQTWSWLEACKIVTVNCNVNWGLSNILLRRAYPSHIHHWLWGCIPLWLTKLWTIISPLTLCIHPHRVVLLGKLCLIIIAELINSHLLSIIIESLSILKLTCT